MIQWQHLFAVSILNRGREYYRKNKVRSLIRDGETFYATVEGSEEYEVEWRPPCTRSRPAKPRTC